MHLDHDSLQGYDLHHNARPSKCNGFSTNYTLHAICMPLDSLNSLHTLSFAWKHRAAMGISASKPSEEDVNCVTLWYTDEKCAQRLLKQSWSLTVALESENFLRSCALWKMTSRSRTGGRFFGLFCLRFVAAVPSHAHILQGCCREVALALKRADAACWKTPTDCNTENASENASVPLHSALKGMKGSWIRWMGRFQFFQIFPCEVSPILHLSPTATAAIALGCRHCRHL